MSMRSWGRLSPAGSLDVNRRTRSLFSTALGWRYKTLPQRHSFTRRQLQQELARRCRSQRDESVRGLPDKEGIYEISEMPAGYPVCPGGAAVVLLRFSPSEDELGQAAAEDRH